MDRDFWITMALMSVAFPIFWVGVLFAMSRLSGWNTLAQKFPFQETTGGDCFWIYSLGFATGYYGNCFYAIATLDQLTLHAIWPFQPFHPPITIPRSAVEDIAISRGTWIFQSVSCTISGRRLTMAGSIARAEFWKHGSEQAL